MYNELDQNFVLFGAVTAGHDGGSGENLLPLAKFCAGLLPDKAEKLYAV